MATILYSGCHLGFSIGYITERIDDSCFLNIQKDTMIIQIGQLNSLLGPKPNFTWRMAAILKSGRHIVIINGYLTVRQEMQTVTKVIQIGPLNSILKPILHTEWYVAILNKLAPFWIFKWPIRRIWPEMSTEHVLKVPCLYLNLHHCYQMLHLSATQNTIISVVWEKKTPHDYKSINDVIMIMWQFCSF